MQKLLIFTLSIFLALTTFTYAGGLVITGPSDELAEITIIDHWVDRTVTSVNIPQATQQNASKANWNEIFAYTDASANLTVTGARLCSPERNYAAVVAFEIPNTWPDWYVDEIVDEVTTRRAKTGLEYVDVFRSKLDPTKCIIDYRNATIDDRRNVKGQLTDDMLTKYRAVFGGFNVWDSWCEAWKKTNITDVE